MRYPQLQIAWYNRYHLYAVRLHLRALLSPKNVVQYSVDSLPDNNNEFHSDICQKNLLTSKKEYSPPLSQDFAHSQQQFLSSPV